jgi:pyruvate/2-oxoglutarate/acetoin dehydrogenase E1 component
MPRTVNNAMQVLELLSVVPLDAVSTTTSIRKTGRRITKYPIVFA